MNGTEYKVFSMADGSVYTGYVFTGTQIPHGPGERKGANFSYTYTGEFKNGAFDGVGTITYPTVVQTQQNSVYYYQGGFRNGMFYGKGEAKYHVPPTFDYSQARCSCYYNGGWRDGVKKGYGTMIYANGERYVGGWNNDMPEGHGELTWNQMDFPKYEGGWKNGVYEGFGRYFAADGSCEYEGGYKAGFKTERRLFASC